MFQLKWKVQLGVVSCRIQKFRLKEKEGLECFHPFHAHSQQLAICFKAVDANERPRPR